MLIKIAKRFKFDAGHKLDWHKGKCKYYHGHTYYLEVEVSGKVNKEGIIMDFGDLKGIVNKYVIDVLDHKNLNEIFENPTAEVMAQVIFKILKDKFPKGVKLRKVILWEQFPESKVIIER